MTRMSAADVSTGSAYGQTQGQAEIGPARTVPEQPLGAG